MAYLGTYTRGPSGDCRTTGYVAEMNVRDGTGAPDHEQVHD